MADRNEIIGPQLPPHLQKPAERDESDDIKKEYEVKVILVFYYLIFMHLKNWNSFSQNFTSACISPRQFCML